jgi:hypothetical protein
MTPEERRRRAVMWQITGKEQGGSGKFYTIEEMAQRAEFELRKREVAYQKLRARRTPAQWTEWERGIAGWKNRVQLLRRDPRLCAMDLRIPASPAALATFERDILDDREALRCLLEFEAEMRGLGCPTILLLVANGPPAVMAIGGRDSYSQPLRGGWRSHCAMQRVPIPVGFELVVEVYNVAAPNWADLSCAPDWPPPAGRGR